MKRFDAIVIGQGYAGLTAAKLAAARGLSTANVERNFAGGLVGSINELHPAPADAESAGGPELTSTVAMLNMDNGVESINAAATAIARDGDSWRVTTEAEEIVTKNLIVASGARLKKLGVPGEEEFAGRGVSECADCDGPLYHNLETVVVGGGDSAFQEALALTHFVAKVTIIMRGAGPRARADLVAAASENDKIVLLPNTQVKAILGDDSGVTGVQIVSTNAGESTLACAGVFVFIGLKPDSDFLPADVTRDDTGAIMTADDCRANLPGLYAIGAVRSGFGGLLSDAAIDAERVIAAI